MPYLVFWHQKCQFWATLEPLILPVFQLIAHLCPTSACHWYMYIVVILIYGVQLTNIKYGVETSVVTGHNLSFLINFSSLNKVFVCKNYLNRFIFHQGIPKKWKCGLFFETQCSLKLLQREHWLFVATECIVTAWNYLPGSDNCTFVPNVSLSFIYVYCCHIDIWRLVNEYKIWCWNFNCHWTPPFIFN